MSTSAASSSSGPSSISPSSSARSVVSSAEFSLDAPQLPSVVGVFLLLDSWRSWYGMQPFPPLHTRVWGWIIIAAIPILFSLARLRKSTSASSRRHRLRHCSAVVHQASCPMRYGYGIYYGSTRTEPSLAAHALVAAFCVFLIWWGVREASRGLVNFGIVAFGTTVAWFYFSDRLRQAGPLARSHRSRRSLSRRRMGCSRRPVAACSRTWRNPRHAEEAQ